MAPEPPQPGPYQSATDINTNPDWMKDPSGGRVLGEGVEVHLDDLKDFSANLDQIQQNFDGLARAVNGPMREMVNGAFPAGEAGFVWTGYFNRLAGHNALQVQTFFTNISMGIRNVASAAQTVHNAYMDTDATQAANLNAIWYAFGDARGKQPDSLKPYGEFPTFADFQRQYPGAGLVIPETGVPPENVRTETVNGVTTMTITIPNNGGTIVIVTAKTANGTTETVTVNGRKVSTTTTTTSGGTTTKTSTTHVYDKDGKPLRDQVDSRDTTSSHRDANGNTITDETRTSYTYDGDGKKTDENTTHSSGAVGSENPRTPTIRPGSEADPQQQQLDKIYPKPTILAPGPLDGSVHGTSPGSGQVTV